FCFFFQAEDGIRDFHVTGVQTCALPIYLHTDVGTGNVIEASAIQAADLHILNGLGFNWEIGGLTCCGHNDPRSRTKKKTTNHLRSEERRVGKESKSQRTKYH